VDTQPHVDDAQVEGGCAVRDLDVGEPRLRVTFRAVSCGDELDRRRRPRCWNNSDELERRRGAGSTATSWIDTGQERTALQQKRGGSGVEDLDQQKGPRRKVPGENGEDRSGKDTTERNTGGRRWRRRGWGRRGGAGSTTGAGERAAR
jgi:hypothetical protein